MAVKLHRCSLMFFKADAHPCWRVQKALDEQGVDYELVTSLGIPRGRRTEVIELTNQNKFPVIEFEDGTAYRDESAKMVETIRAGKLYDAPRSGGAGGSGGDAAGGGDGGGGGGGNGGGG